MSSTLTFDEFIDKVSANIAFFLRDFDYANVLHEGKEFDKRPEIEAAINRAMAEVESIPPFITFNYDAFVSKNTIFQQFSKLTAAMLLEAEGLRQFRNEAQSTETGTTSGILDKSQQYTAYADKLKREALLYFQTVIDKLNFIGAYGGIVTGSYLRSGGYWY